VKSSGDPALQRDDAKDKDKDNDNPNHNKDDNANDTNKPHKRAKERQAHKEDRLVIHEKENKTDATHQTRQEEHT
jgi:hypothetical protein